MILKITKGRGARGLLNYLLQPSKVQAGARVIDQNLAGKTPRELANEVAVLRRLRPALRRAIGHLVISHDPSQRALNDSDWQRAANIARDVHGFGDAPYLVVRHEETEHQHVHVFFCEYALMDLSFPTPMIGAGMKTRRARSSRRSACRHQMNRDWSGARKPTRSFAPAEERTV